MSTHRSEWQSNTETPLPATPIHPARKNSPTTLAHTNTFAVVAVILAFVQPVAGIVCGHIGLAQIQKNGDSGRGIALTALIISYVYTFMILVIVVAYIGFFAFWALALASAPIYSDAATHVW